MTTPKNDRAPNSAASRLRQALNFHQSGKWVEAEALYRGILADDPKHPDALHLLGMLAIQTGHPAAAVDLITQAIEISGSIAGFHVNLGVALKNTGRFPEALESFDRALALDPTLADTHNNRGNVLSRLGKWEEALLAYDNAINLRREYPEAWCNKAVTEQRLQDWEGAERSLEFALSLQPDNVRALIQLGTLKQRHGDLSRSENLLKRAFELDPRNIDAASQYIELLVGINKASTAIQIVDRIVSVNPASAEAYRLRGLVNIASGQHELALVDFDVAISLNPSHAKSYWQRGIAKSSLGLFDAALLDFDESLRLDPNLTQARLNTGITLRKIGKVAEALDNLNQFLVATSSAQPNEQQRAAALSQIAGCLIDLGKPTEACIRYEEALGLTPENPEILYNFGLALQQAGDLPAALAQYDKALNLDSKKNSLDRATVLSNKGAALHALQQPEQAVACFESAHATDPQSKLAWNNKGAAHRSLLQLQPSIDCFDQAIRLDPTYANPHFNKSLTLLLAGDYRQGWQLYEWRYQVDVKERSLAQPKLKNLDNLAGKSVLLHAEQGFGDSIQFCRYATLVAERGADITLLVPPRLKRLMTSLAGCQRVIDDTETIPLTDFHCSVMSLPNIFGTTVESIPAEVPYLKADPALQDKWQALLGVKTRPRMGLAWRGSKLNKADRNRSIDLKDLTPLFELNFDWFSLQIDASVEELSILNQYGVKDLSHEQADFADAAAFCEQLDMIISVDTSIAHLSGALAKPTWILLAFEPDFRWLLERDDSPWYPTVRLFRQTQGGDWTLPRQHLVNALQEHFATNLADD